MATLTIRLSARSMSVFASCQLSERRKISMNRLIEKHSTVALTEFDAETRFRVRAALGCREEGLALLDLLDREQ